MGVGSTLLKFLAGGAGLCGLMWVLTEGPAFLSTLPTFLGLAPITLSAGAVGVVAGMLAMFYLGTVGKAAF